MNVLLLCAASIHLMMKGARSHNENQTLIKNHRRPIYSTINDTIGIYYGHDVSWNDFPFIVVIYDEEYDNPCCGGSIIQLSNKATILTAGHCYTNCRNPTYVVIGCNGAYCNDEEATTYQIDYWVVHPLYSAVTADYDIALIYLTESINIPNNVEALPLYSSTVDPSNGAILIVLGYGKTQNEEYATVLQSGDEHYMIQSICRTLMEWWTPDLTSRMFCMRSNREDTAVCMGDSGTPVMIFNNNYEPPRVEQIGIVSWGMGQSCSGALPQVQTNLADQSLQNWIAANTNLT